MSKEFVNDYGEDTTTIRRELVKCNKTLEVLKRKDLLKETGVLQLKMLSEILLLLATDYLSISQLVHQVRDK